MKKNTKRLIQIIGGIIMMTGISGCGASGNHQDTSSSITESRVKASRTPEAVAVEAQFEPLFEFLAAEKKDFSRVERYYSSLSIENKEVEDEEEYVLKFEKLAESNEGKYIYTSEVQETDSIVLLDRDMGTVKFSNSEIQTNINPFLINVIHSEDFTECSISSYLSNHSKTELIDIFYNIDEQFPVISSVIDYYKIENIKTLQASVSRMGRNEYSYQFLISSTTKRYIFGAAITFKD